MLKIVLAFVPCWVLYLLGDLVSALVVRWDASAGVLHPVASRLLLWSDAVQTWAQGDRWFPWGTEAETWPDDDEAGGCLAPACGGVPAESDEWCADRVWSLLGLEDLPRERLELIAERLNLVAPFVHYQNLIRKQAGGGSDCGPDGVGAGQKSAGPSL